MSEGNPIDYRTSSRDYLFRAKSFFNVAGPPEHLFYAAYELRCGIEARLKEYLDVQKEIPKKLKNGWRIAHLGRGVKKYIPDSEHILRFYVKAESTNSSAVLLYTPVSKLLQAYGGQLGELLHYVSGKEAKSESWWNNAKTLIGETYVELFKANIGVLLGPPLVKNDGQDMEVRLRFGDEVASKQYLDRFCREGAIHTKASFHHSIAEIDLSDISYSLLSSDFVDMADYLGQDRGRLRRVWDR